MGYICPRPSFPKLHPQPDSSPRRTSSAAQQPPRLRSLPSCFLALTAALACLAPSPTTSAQAQSSAPNFSLGANVNESLPWLLPNLLRQSSVTWVRGFVPASEFLDGQRSYKADPGLATLKAAARSGQKVALSIKWDSAGRGHAGPVPHPGSSQEKDWFAFTDHLLDAMSGSLSLFVLNNELYIDAKPEDLQPDSTGQVPIDRFLSRLADHVAAEHRTTADGSPLPLYVGGFTRLDHENNQTSPATTQMLAIINNNPNITGADYHLHQPDMATTLTAMEFMHRHVPSKPLMVTEFSLVWKWKAHILDPIGATDAGKQFAQKYGISPKATVLEFSNDAFAHPIPEAEWQAFLASQPWFEPHYLTSIARLMRANGIVLATYAFTLNPLITPQMPPRHLRDNEDPWYLNQLFIPGLALSPDPKRAPENYGMFDDFVSLQHN